MKIMGVEQRWSIPLTLAFIFGYARLFLIPFTVLPHDLPAVVPGIRDLNVGVDPYGWLWYWINYPIGQWIGWQPRLYQLMLGATDIPFLWLAIRRHYLFFMGYVTISTWMLFKAPWNMSILWLTFLGFLWIPLLILPILAKLPAGWDLTVWRTLHSRVTHQNNWFYYLLLGAFWILVIVEKYDLKKRFIGTDFDDGTQGRP